MSVSTCFCSCKQGIIEHFCASHKIVFCSICKSTQHIECKTCNIDQVIEDETAVNENTPSSYQIDRLLDKSQTECREQDGLLEELTEREKQLREEINDFRTEINDVLDRLQEASVNELKDHVQKQEAIINDRKKICETITKEIRAFQQLSVQIEDKKRLFIENLTFKQTLNDYETAIDDVNKESYAPTIDFTGDERLESMQYDMEKMGSYYSFTKHCQVSLKSTQEHTNKEKCRLIDIEPTRVNEFSVTSQWDVAPDYSAAIFMETGDLLLADYRNEELVLLDTSFQVKGKISTLGQPWDLTRVDGNQVIYSMGGCQGLQYVQVYPKLECGHQIPLGGMCFGAKYFNGRIYVTCSNPNNGEIKVLDRYGELIKTLVLCDGKHRFTHPYYVDINDRGDRLYIIDWGCEHTVACFKTDGTFVFKYSHMDLNSPRHLVVDGDDNVLVGVPATFQLHAITSDGTHHRTIQLGEMKKGFRSMAFDFKRKNMLVCCYEQKEMYLYKFD